LITVFGWQNLSCFRYAPLLVIFWSITPHLKAETLRGLSDGNRVLGAYFWWWADAFSEFYA
jgi:hypothetical protein